MSVQDEIAKWKPIPPLDRLHFVSNRERALEARLRTADALLAVIAGCGVEHTTRKYLVAQIDHTTWADARAYLAAREGER